MDRKRYIETQQQLLEIARSVRALPLDEMVSAIRITEEIAPIADPAAWRSAAKNLGMIRRLAESALAFKASFPDVGAVLEGALDATLGRDLPGAGFALERPIAPAAHHGDEERGPGDTLDGSHLRTRAGARAYPPPATTTRAQ